MDSIKQMVSIWIKLIALGPILLGRRRRPCLCRRRALGSALNACETRKFLNDISNHAFEWVVVRDVFVYLFYQFEAHFILVYQHNHRQTNNQELESYNITSLWISGLLLTFMISRNLTLCISKILLPVLFTQQREMLSSSRFRFFHLKVFTSSSLLLVPSFQTFFISNISESLS